MRHLLRATTADKLRKIKTRASTAYDACPNSSHRLLKIKSGLLHHSNATSTLHKITKPDKTKVTSLSDVLKAVHSHFDAELSRATPPVLPTPPWQLPDNHDNFTIEPRGNPSLADMTTRDAFDKTIHSLGTGQSPRPRRYP
jgi:hypothetical protein